MAFDLNNLKDQQIQKPQIPSSEDKEASSNFQPKDISPQSDKSSLEKELKPAKKKRWFSSLFKKRKGKSKPEQEKKPKQDQPLSKLKKQKKKRVFQKSAFGGEESSSLGISLMPEKTVIIPRLVRSRLLLLVAFLVIILTIFILVWLYSGWYFEKVKYEVKKTEREIQFVQAQTKPLLGVRDQIAELEYRATRTENILNNHIYWTKFFSLLEKYTLPQIYFGDFKASTGETVNLNAVGEDLMAIAQQIVTFAQAEDFVKEVKTTGIAKTPIGIKANFQLFLKKDVFKR